jgi:predicted nucleic-acid-binding Zn-ribbon protein
MKGLAGWICRVRYTDDQVNNSKATSQVMDNTNKACRNCGSSELYSKDISLDGYVGALLPVGWFSSKDVHLRVCGSCGLLEWFVAPETLDKVKQKFSRDS